jgi:hypothetical protein
MQAWPSLPSAIKAGILALCQHSGLKYVFIINLGILAILAFRAMRGLVDQILIPTRAPQAGAQAA